MKNRIYVVLTSILLLSACSSSKKLEATAPFTLGEVYAQKWIITATPGVTGYEVVIPIISLSENEAVLKNLYYNGKMEPLEIKLMDLGNVAVAEFGADSPETGESGIDRTMTERQSFPFDLTETQAVISYVQNRKVRYYKINGIRQNPVISYPTSQDRKQH